MHGKPKRSVVDKITIMVIKGCSERHNSDFKIIYCSERCIMHVNLQLQYYIYRVEEPTSWCS